MKELVATAHNLFYTRGEDGRFEPNIELILITSEPEYRVRITDNNVRTRKDRKNKTARVTCSPVALGLLMKTAIDAMEEIKKQAESDNSAEPPQRVDD